LPIGAPASRPRVVSDLRFRVPSRKRASPIPNAACDRIPDLAQALAVLLDDAADAGARTSRQGLESNARGKGFTDADPTGTGALDPRRSQIRRAARRAGHLVARAEPHSRRPPQ
jgi:hypothetical protein